MATSKEFHDYVVDSLQRVGNISTKRMMGEYCIYYRDKLVGDICDNTLLLKPTESVLRLMPDADRAYPYEGSKTLMAVVDDVENVELMEAVLNAMYEELPEPKKKVKKTI
ncbi:MAG: TfoX/Sxy family protein [Lachnospiraceae bacterium]|nr:TfoX/Sxy family protein [Lachnospiraceae bacterium]